MLLRLQRRCLARTHRLLAFPLSSPPSKRGIRQRRSLLLRPQKRGRRGEEPEGFRGPSCACQKAIRLPPGAGCERSGPAASSCFLRLRVPALAAALTARAGAVARLVGRCMLNSAMPRQMLHWWLPLGHLQPSSPSEVLPDMAAAARAYSRLKSYTAA
jgi:hypothetical protein